MIYDVVILGAGAAGMFTAVHLKHDKILMIDANESVGKKIAISGGGRCNITNEVVCADNYLGDTKFVQPFLDAFDSDAVMEYFHSRGLKTVVEKNRQYFCKHSAKDLIDILLSELKGVHIKKSESVSDVKYDEVFIVKTSRDTYRAKQLLIATGGPCLPKIGASDIGIKLAEHFGHESRVFEPVLVGLSLQKDQFWMKELSGISFKASVSVGKKKFTDQLLFAHKGISGPAVLSASLYWKKSSVIIDFIPDFKLKELLKDKKKLISNQIPLPKRFVKAFLEAIDLEDKPVGRLSSEEQEKLSLLKSYNFAPAGNFGLSRAEATRGGILVDDINPQSMESLKQKGLFFAGEVVDVTGELGGYNFQWAFSSAFAVAQALNSQK